MTNDQSTVMTDQSATPSETLAERLLDIADADLRMIGRSDAEFDASFDNSFDNSFSNIA